MPSGPRNIYYGWWVVATTFTINMLLLGLYYVGFTVLFLPFSRDLNINRTLASLPFSLARGIGALSSPIAGIATDRIGPSKVFFVGTIISGLGYILLSRSPTYIFFLIVFVLVITPGVHGGMGAPGPASVSRWFRKQRGLAFFYYCYWICCWRVHPRSNNCARSTKPRMAHYNSNTRYLPSICCSTTSRSFAPFAIFRWNHNKWSPSKNLPQYYRSIQTMCLFRSRYAPKLIGS